EIHDHRPLLAGLVVVWKREDALQPEAVLVLEVEQDPVAPGELCLLRVDAGDLLRALEVGSRDPEIGKLDERLPREEVRLGLERARRRAERRVLVDDFLQRAVRRELEEARLLRVPPVGRERDRLREIDRLPAGATATATAAATGPAGRRGRRA